MCGNCESWAKILRKPVVENNFHIGASWTEGGKWKCGKFSILSASNEKNFFSRIVVFGHSLSFKMTYWNYM